MQFNAGAASQKMVMELISSANDICMLGGICDYLGQRKQVDLESRFLLQESRKLPVCLEHLLRDISHHEQAAEGNLWPILDEASTDAVVEKANVARGKELVRLCNVAGSTLRQGHPETALVSFAHCREVDRPTNSKGGCMLRRRKPGSKNGPVKVMSISTQKDD